jgi:hypothetical protein
MAKLLKDFMVKLLIALSNYLHPKGYNFLKINISIPVWV